MRTPSMRFKQPSITRNNTVIPAIIPQNLRNALPKNCIYGGAQWHELLFRWYEKANLTAALSSLENAINLYQNAK